MYAGLVIMVYLCVIRASLQYGPHTITSFVLQHFDRVKIPIQIIVPVSLGCGLLLRVCWYRKTYYKDTFVQLYLLFSILICIYGTLTYIIEFENLAFCDDEEHTAINSTIRVQPMLLISFKYVESVFDIIIFYYSLAELLTLIPIKLAKLAVIIFYYSLVVLPTLLEPFAELLKLVEPVVYVIIFYFSIVTVTFRFVHSHVEEMYICMSILMINLMTVIMRDYISALISTNVACSNQAMTSDVTICPLSHFSNSTYKMCSTPPTVFALLDNPCFFWFYHVILTPLFLEFMFLYYPNSVGKCAMKFGRLDRAFGRIVVLEIYKAFSSKLKNSIITDTKNDALVNFVHSICNNGMDGVQTAPQCATTQPTQRCSVKEKPIIAVKQVNILEAAGGRVQQEYIARRKVNNKYTRHGVVVTSSGYLTQYKKIIHIKMFHDSPAKFRNAVHMALCLADKEGMRSIAFSALNSPAMVNSYLRVFYNFERESSPACLHSIEVLTSCEAEQDYHETRMSQMGESLY